MIYREYVKRILDLFFSFVFIVLLLPLFLIISIFIMISIGCPIIFKQERVGLNEKVFTMYKFRTMSDKRDEKGDLLPDELRHTKIGKLLRSTSLDELPELFNILIGDISFVGPRPLLVSYLPYYTEEERKRHLVRGGLTVPEVVYGNVNPSWDEQFKYEVDYVKHVSFMLDLKIVWKTFMIIIQRVESDYGSEVREALNVERAEVYKQ